MNEEHLVPNITACDDNLLGQIQHGLDVHGQHSQEAGAQPIKYRGLEKKSAHLLLSCTINALFSLIQMYTPPVTLPAIYMYKALAETAAGIYGDPSIS